MYKFKVIGGNQNSEVKKDDTLDDVATYFINRLSEMFQSAETNDFIIEHNGNSFSIIGDGWILYQDAGINGSKISRGSEYGFHDKKPPIEAIKKWVATKGIPDKAAWAIREKIFQEGFEGKHFLDEEIEQLANDVAEVSVNKLKKMIYE